MMSSKNMSSNFDGVNTAVVLRARTVTGLLCPLGFANAIFSRPSAVVDSCAATFDEMNAKPFGSTTPSRYPLRLRTHAMSWPSIRYVRSSLYVL